MDGYMRDRPLAGTDALGLVPFWLGLIPLIPLLGGCGRKTTPVRPIRTPTQCCKEAGKLGKLRQLCDGVGICFDGRLVLCSFADPTGDPVADTIIDRCVKVHENEHLDAWMPCGQETKA